VLLTNSFDQGLRFSTDKASYELLYLPLPAAIKSPVKVTIDTMINRFADAVGGVLLGVTTKEGFNLLLVHLPGVGFGIRGLAALNLLFIGGWIAITFALRRGYLDVIQDSIRQHRLDAKRAADAMRERSTAALLTSTLKGGTPEEIVYALTLLEGQPNPAAHPAVRALLRHEAPLVRRTALALLNRFDAGDAVADAERLLTDPDLETRTEALLYLAHHARVDPLERLQQLGDFPDFSIRAGMVGFLAQPGRFQNLDAAHVLLAGMVGEDGPDGRSSRLEAARLLGRLPDVFGEELQRLLADDDVEVAREAIRAAGRLERTEAAPLVMDRLARPELVPDAVDALARIGEPIVDDVRRRLFDASCPIEIKRELPGVLVRIGTPEAEQALMESILEGDATLRLRVVAALNKLREQDAEFEIDRDLVEIALTAEIMGHYRSYQLLGRLRASLDERDAAVTGLKQSMEQEIERIFRLMGLLLPGHDLHSIHFGLQSDTPAVRANALELLDNILRPQLRNVLVPLLDGYVSVAERVRLANRLLGTAVETDEEAMIVMLRSQDNWVRSCAVSAIGALRLRSMESELDALLDDPDQLLREAARLSKLRLYEEPVHHVEPAPGEADEERAFQEDQGMGVG
jgi:AAA family ATP:ADP antiporter